MIWLSILVTSLFFAATFIMWQSKKTQLKKRIWRQVQVDNLVKVKQHKAGPLEMLGESSLLVEFTFNDINYCCQTAFRSDIYSSFRAQQPTFILIDPEQPEQCFYNACQQTRYVKLWVYLSLCMSLCLIALSLIKSI
ncbi:hypothetical protein D9981_10915 [Pseudoalteromonas phenolica O-BC30]|uniref:DUF3592 domain-containing protein n=1 Tax=Pseudoalteromonas phenolica TaxID=161398 RepID=A0A0S2K2D9_9GAMM|nr:hypothetical protein PP2015_1742 [Pseudoalteromonas phenolica]RXE96919.1 hypothetical protein D9981_10915 [Pseudoalteromonas phenolica O-BC30]TMO56625.1 hypothetical protein CWC21_05495 [Pseudoalteromonas phenolica]